MPSTLKALFRFSKGSISDDAIVTVTGGPEVHCEAVISENPARCFSATLLTGVRITGYLGGSFRFWYGFDTGLVIPDEAMRWAFDECGQPYALLHAILSGFKTAAPHELQPLFCSNAFAVLYNMCNPPVQFSCLRPNPALLAQWLANYPRMAALPPELFVA